MQFAPARRLLILLVFLQPAMVSALALVNGNFAIDNPSDPGFGWTRTGNVTVAGGQAIITEDGVVSPVTLGQEFTLPAGVSGMTIILAAVNLGANSVGPMDAFEIRLTNPSTGNSLLSPIPTLSGTDAFFNLQQTGIVHFSPGVTVPGATVSGSSWSPTFPAAITVDLSGTATERAARLRFELIGFDTVSSAIRIEGVALGVPPVATIDTGLEVNEDGTLDVDLLANDTDADGDLDPLSVEIVANPTSGTVTVNRDNGMVTYRPEANFSGFDGFSYRVHDAGGNPSNTATVAVTIHPLNDPPVIASTPALTIDEDAAYVYTITATDIDNGAPVIAAPTRPSWLTLTDNGDGTGRLSGTPTNADVGQHPVEIAATDNPGASAVQQFVITVVNVNDAPTFLGTPPTAATEDVPYTYNVSTTDLDGNPLTIVAQLLPAWLNVTDHGNGTATVTGTPLNAYVGSHNVTLAVSDAIAPAVLQAFTITVANTNDAPVIATAPVLTAIQNILYNYIVTATDDDGDAIAISALVLPAWLQFTDNHNGTAQLSGIPNNDAVGNHEVTVRAQDGNGGANSQSFTIAVANVNDLPLFTSVPAATAVEDQEYRYNVTTIDIDGDILAIQATVLPSWMGLTDHGDGSATLVGTPAAADAGNHNVTLKVTDAIDSFATQDFVVTVTVVNDAPIFVSTPPLAVRVSSIYSYAITATDEEGDAITIVATTIPPWLGLLDHGNGTAVLNGTPADGNMGTNNVVLEAADASAKKSTQNFTIVVLSSDADGDGLPDAWEEDHFGNLAFGPEDNPDGDKLINRHEFDVGRDPAAADTDIDVLDVTPGWNLLSIPDYVVNPTPANLFAGRNLGAPWVWQEDRFITIGDQEPLDYRKGTWVYFEDGSPIFLLLQD